MRNRVEFAPSPPNFRDAKLVVVAIEDTKASLRYFDELATFFTDDPKIQVKVLDPNERTGNDPEKVWQQLVDFQGENEVREDDIVEFWAVVDIDRYQQGTHQHIRSIAEQCQTKSNFHLAVSNPAIEIWFLLHFRDVSLYEKIIFEELFENYKVDGEGNRKLRAERTRLEFELLETNPNGRRYNKSNLNVDDFLPRNSWREVLEVAIERAIKLDVNPDSRWPQQLGTRVYRLMLSILRYHSQMGELYV